LILAASLAAAFAALSAAAPATGYAGKGRLVIGTTLASAPLAVAGDIALEARGQQLRLDLLDLAIPGSGQILSSLISTQLIPAGGFTVVYDRGASTYTVWSSAKHAYYVGGGAPSPTTAPAQPGAADAALGAGADLLKAFAFARSLKDDTAFTVTLSLAGHGNVNGHPATGLDYQYSRTTLGGDTTNVHGRLQLADDLDDVPIQVTAALSTKSIPSSTLSLDLTTLEQSNPPASDFAPPAGYLRANAIGDVLGKTLQL
jgi:hypothetical protein